jgi:hypothetical protein
MSSSEDESLDFPVGVWSDIGNKVNNMCVYGSKSPHGSEGAKKIEREAAWGIYNYIKISKEKKPRAQSLQKEENQEET